MQFYPTLLTFVFHFFKCVHNIPNYVCSNIKQHVIEVKKYALTLQYEKTYLKAMFEVMERTNVTLKYMNIVCYFVLKK